MRRFRNQFQLLIKLARAECVSHKIGDREDEGLPPGALAITTHSG